MSRLNLSSQSPISNLESGFATFTNGNIYRSATDELEIKQQKNASVRPINNNTSADYTANLVIKQTSKDREQADFATDKMRHNRSEVKWMENKVKVVDGR